MFTLYDRQKQKHPIKIWLDGLEQIEEECLQQAINLSNLPFIYKWVALMPDTHSGYGMPIGGIIATEGVIIPNAVGVDIGCGMAFVETNLHKSELEPALLKNLVGTLMRDIPTGFAHHKKKMPCETLDSFVSLGLDRGQAKELTQEINNGYYQVGTLGSGNHFIELQEDESGMVCIMLHSGSRNFGLKIAKYFNHVAKELNRKMCAPVPEEFDLAFLPVDSREGKNYILWMNLALEFAKENRSRILGIIKEGLMRKFSRVVFSNEVNAHHNYAAMEHHFGKDVWVHRKGAIRVMEDEMGIIPGAMGAYSFIVRGKGNPESFYSCSHGAGRKMSRSKAKAEFSVDQTINDLKNLGVILGKTNKKDVSEECRFAYKNINLVINNQLDLIEPVKRLKTIAVIKG